MPQVRLQKILADAGLGSRRKCERFIEEGRVSVNGKTVCLLGSKADPEADDIRLNNSRVRAERKVYLLVYKPRGYICTNAAEGKKRVVDLVAGEVRERLYPVGRLDVDSEGLIILTNDGELAHELAHPRHGVEKRYLVKVEGHVDQDLLDKLSRGTHLSDGRTTGMSVSIRERKGRSVWLDMGLREGRNREIRRALARWGCRVRRLKRIRIAGLRDPKLKPGEFRRLTPKEVRALRTAADTPSAPTKKHTTKKHKKPYRRKT